MIKTLFLFAIMVSHLTFSYAQWDWCHLNLENTWVEYKYVSRTDLSVAKWASFRDTVSIEEMKAAFLTNHEKHWNISPYLGFDSIKTAGSKWLVIKSPKDNMHLQDIFADRKIKDNLTGTIIALKEPKLYMGFVVSPYPTYAAYEKGELVGHSGMCHGGGADFFSYSQQSVKTHDLTWNDSIASGAKLLGTIINLERATEQDWQECTFTALIYEKPNWETRTKPEYKAELLEPTYPSPNISYYFQSFQWIIQNLPYRTFKPYYTSDGRILLGRYLRVTVNKCGWLVEDYMDINSR